MTMRRMQLRPITILVFALIGLCLYWFFANFEYRTETNYVGYRGAARYNALLAAERFLAQQNLDTHTFRSIPPALTQLPEHGTVMVLQHDYVLTEAAATTLLEWVEKTGGHLILTSRVVHPTPKEIEEGEEDEWEAESDHILDYLRLRQYATDFGKETPEETTSLVEFVWQGTPIGVNFDTAFYLEPFTAPNFAVGSDQGLHILQYELGTGIITVLSDLWFIENANIGEDDHAWFLWQLVTQRDSESPFFILTLLGSQFPSLTSLVWDHAWMLVIILAVVLLFGLWQNSRRLGPILPPPSTRRRSLLEHIEANGHFLWRHQHAESLLSTLRNSVLQNLHTAYPHWRLLDRAELAREVAALHALAPEALTRALQTTPPSDEADFTQRVQLLAQLRKLL